MKPTVINAANASNSTNTAGGGGNADAAANAIHIPINHEYSPHFANAEANASASYGSPNSHGQQQIPAHFQQGFGFDPSMDMDMDMDMFSRGRLGRMHHDPFGGFGGGSHFGFPQFGSMGRRRMPASTADTMGDDGDFFNRLPSEFRQYIPEGFGHRRAGSGTMPHPQHSQQQQQVPPQQQHYQQYHPNYVPGSTPPTHAGAGIPPPSPSKKLCDAAIQTEDVAASQDQVDHAAPPTAMHTDNLNQHGLRNTVDMGVKAAPESEQHGQRAHSAPPPEQMQPNNARRATPPQQTQFGTQTSPQVAPSNAYQKAYYAPQQQPHPQQKQQTPPPSTPQPQTPGGTYIRTIPIFVEGRSEPIINAHKEIPNQNAPPQSAPHAQATASAKANAGYHHPQQQQQQFYAPQQHQQPHPQQQRPSPLNTQQQPPQQQAAGRQAPPQTPHTLDSINKIQDIQRDVLDLMSQVEKFTGTRKDKEYVYLDEMLTRNLLKLDTIDTNGKDSIRLARKEAIKCIQASINVLEAKAEENAKTAQGGAETAVQSTTTEAPTEEAAAATSFGSTDATNESKQQEPIPLPPPPSDDNAKADNATKEASPPAAAAGAGTEPTNNNNSTANETK